LGVVQVFGLTKAEEIMPALEAVGGPSHVPPPLHAEVVVPHSTSEPPLNSDQGSSVPSEEKPEAEVVEVGTEAGDGRQGVEQHQQQQQQSGTSGVGEDGRANAGEEGNQTDKASDWGEGSGHGDAAQADRTSEPSHGGDGSNAAGTVRYLVASGEEEDSALPRGEPKATFYFIKLRTVWSYSQFDTTYDGASFLLGQWHLVKVP
jgi:cobalamin biosynthesis protein CobT